MYFLAFKIFLLLKMFHVPFQERRNTVENDEIRIEKVRRASLDKAERRHYHLACLCPGSTVSWSKSRITTRIN